MKLNPEINISKRTRKDLYLNIFVLFTLNGVISCSNIFDNARLKYSRVTTPQEIIQARAKMWQRVARKNLVQAVGEEYDLNSDGVLSESEKGLVTEVITGGKTKNYSPALENFTDAELNYILEQEGNEKNKNC